MSENEATKTSVFTEFNLNTLCVIEKIWSTCAEPKDHFSFSYNEITVILCIIAARKYGMN